jgi:predicted kinase
MRTDASDVESPIVVQMHGVPGSGKSTIARGLAPRVDAVVLDKDVIKSALMRDGLSFERSASAAYEVYFAVAQSLLEQGRSVILDNPVMWPTVEQRWLELCEAADCPPILIECVCPDAEELQRRLATRSALASQPSVPLDLAKHPGSSPTEYRPRLTLDTTRPIVELLHEADRFISDRAARYQPVNR